MDWRWRPFSERIMPMVATTIGGIQATEEAMYTITQAVNGSAEYRVAKAIEEEAVSRSRHINWWVVSEVFFTAVLFGVIVWSLWQ